MKVIDYILSMWLLWIGISVCCMIYQILNGFTPLLVTIEFTTSVLVGVQLIKEIRDDGI